MIAKNQFIIEDNVGKGANAEFLFKKYKDIFLRFPIELIPYKDKKAVYQQLIGDPQRPYVIVPGYQKSEIYNVSIETGEIIPDEKILGWYDPKTNSYPTKGQIHPCFVWEIMDVEPIADADKKVLEEIISKTTKGPINFW